MIPMHLKSRLLTRPLFSSARLMLRFYYSACELTGFGLTHETLKLVGA